jgi:hypothetical protein
MGNRKHSLSRLNSSSSSGGIASAAAAADGPLQPHAEPQQQQQDGTANSSSTCSCDGVSSSSADCSGSNGSSSSSLPPHALVNAWGGPPPGCNMAAVVPGSWDERYTHFYSISPDACTNPTIYWLGR